MCVVGLGAWIAWEDAGEPRGACRQLAGGRYGEAEQAVWNARHAWSRWCGMDAGGAGGRTLIGDGPVAVPSRACGWPRPRQYLGAGKREGAEQQEVQSHRDGPDVTRDLELRALSRWAGRGKACCGTNGSARAPRF